jgi:chromosome partitioning protein
VHGRVIPANLRLAEAELTLAGKIGREVTLRNALRDEKRKRDVILIDCPPTLGLLTVNALVAATHAILSTEAQYFSLQGMDQAVEVLDLARDSLNPELELLGVCLNIANMRTRHARQTLEALRERFGDKVFRSVIRPSIVYAESAERAVPILDYRPAKGADYLSLAGEVLRRLGKQEMLERLDELSAELAPGGPRPHPVPVQGQPEREPEPVEPEETQPEPVPIGEPR